MAKFPWGDAPMPMPLLCVGLLIVALLLGVFLALTGPVGGLGEVFPTAPELHGVALVTCIFMLMWYVFLGNQVSMKFAGMPPGDVATQAKFIADRAVINTQEQAMPFLMLMWLEAIFVNPLTAMRLGWIYVVFRYFFPVFYGIYGQFTILVEISTQVGYIINFYYLLTVFFKCLNGTDIHAKIDSTSPWLMLPFLVLCSFCSFICYLLLAAPTTQIIIKGVKHDLECADEEWEDDDEDAELN